jgi:glycosyltransferase involved in cell wall biosynthesis
MAKITFLGNFNVDYSSESHHAKTLESLGHEVIRFQEGKDISETIYRSAIKSNLFIWVHTHGWTTPGKIPMVKVLNNLKRYKVPTITYHLDLWLGLNRQNDLRRDDFYRSIEHFFTVDKLMADWFNQNTKVKGHFVPAGVYDKECYIHEDYDRNDFQYDVIFVGSKGYHPEHQFRPQLIDFLRETYKDKFLHVGGDGDTGTVRGHDLNKIYAMSKIAIGDSLNLNFDYPYYTSDRLFESTGRGGFTIYPRIVGLEKYFNDNEIVWYEHGNFDDLKSKIDYYLKHDEERENIRFAGHERTKNEHTYLNRWQSILEELKIS